MPVIVITSDVNQVMREQLEFLIEHAGTGRCGCRICKMYMEARELLTLIFKDEPKTVAAGGKR